MAVHSLRDRGALVLASLSPRVRKMVEVLVEHADMIESPGNGQVTLHFCRDTSGQERPIVADVQTRTRLQQGIDL